MKLVMICYNAAIDDEVTELLDRMDIKGYTKWTKVLGKGQTSEPHLLSHIWPKANNVIATVVPDEVAQTVLQDIRNMKGKVGRVGLKAFLLPVDQIT